MDRHARKEGEELRFAPDEQTPYTGWVKLMHLNGQVGILWHYKDGKKDGPASEEGEPSSGLGSGVVQPKTRLSDVSIRSIEHRLTPLCPTHMLSDSPSQRD